jgi:DNA-binding phage protein
VPPQRKVKPRSPDHAALGEAIELLIAEDPNKTKQTVADDAGFEMKQLGALMRGTSNPTFSTMLRLSDGLHVRLGVLLTVADGLRDRRFGK